ncbi:CoA-transferase family III [Microthyrium microscopicum]|uniref:CoA-transferase family III n=1 Tax=Microthyrium microscopicum TaxID=703497 RepID=A0A6A6U9I7_9PEZI|nr:CoA-transferase family III [Microthyrium microscopicum]
MQSINRVIPDRSKLSTTNIITEVWASLGLPASALSSVHLPGDGPGLLSSFKVGQLAQSTIALSGLSAALVHAARNRFPTVPTVTVPLQHACAEFNSEKHLCINGKPKTHISYPIGGLHRSSDGWVRIHDGFPHHRQNALALLNVPRDSSKATIDAAISTWKAKDLEEQGMKNGCVIAALRSFEEWDTTPQAAVLPDLPIKLTKLPTNTPNHPRRSLASGNTKCLEGIRVLDFSRVLAAPIAGRTLAAHGADVLWITAPHLPDLPECDRDTARGKRSVQLDLCNVADKQKFYKLLEDADVVLQAYRPGALAGLGLSTEELVKRNPSLVVANLSAWGTEGEWKGRRGYDSIVQTATGLNVAEGQAAGEEARVLPCQALDHGSGYLLATGIAAALYRREVEGGSWVVEVSLAGTGRYLRSLGRHEGRSGFDVENLAEDDLKGLLETKESGFGSLTALKHSVSIQDVSVGWEVMPKPLGSDEARWL